MNLLRPNTEINPLLGKFTPTKILKKIWRHTGHRWIRKVEFLIMSRPLSEPNLARPKGKDSPMRDGDSFFMESASHEMIDGLRDQFPVSKLKVFHDMVNHPDVDFLIRIKPDGECLGYTMHAFKPVKDVVYKYTIPIIPGKEVLQFDGWVNPKHRGRLVAIMGTNFAFDRRRASGHESIIDAVRCIDRAAMKFHVRFGYQPVGKITHYRIGKIRWNKLQMNGRD